ncbi:MAG TPA: dipeptide epimerase [Polyangiaceae bacterium]|nr:dipeptide epimerase [Polyangiaceae bacterium]
MTRIAEISAQPFDLTLSEPFAIATGTQERAANVLLRLRCEDGTLGLGEAAPFPAVNAETQTQALSALERAKGELVGASIGNWRATAERAGALLAESPSALCAFETALLDAFCRRARLSLFEFFGGRQGALSTDITITTGSVQAARAAALRAHSQGFSQLKLKVGGAPLELDLERVRVAADAAPEAELLLDGNASFEAGQALRLLEKLGALARRVVLFEQPTAASDFAGLREVRRLGGVLVAADESARSRADVARLAREHAVDVVNIKITKTGIVEALDMIGCARSHGLGLMVGGMVESRLCMTTSACLAGGIGGFRFVDLDTPLFLRDDPCLGGFTQHGPKLDLRTIAHGHGVTLPDAKSC